MISHWVVVFLIATTNPSFYGKEKAAGCNFQMKYKALSAWNSVITSGSGLVKHKLFFPSHQFCSDTEGLSIVLRNSVQFLLMPWKGCHAFILGCHLLSVTEPLVTWQLPDFRDASRTYCEKYVSKNKLFYSLLKVVKSKTLPYREGSVDLKFRGAEWLGTESPPPEAMSPFQEWTKKAKKSELLLPQGRNANFNPNPKVPCDCSTRPPEIPPGLIPAICITLLAWLHHRGVEALEGSDLCQFLWVVVTVQSDH